MAMHTFGLTTGRLNKFAGEIIGHAEPDEVLSKLGRQVPMPQNESDTYVARRFLPYGALATNANTQNQFFQAGTGDRTAAVIQAHATQEGVTPSPDSLTPIDITVVVQEYSCLYGFTNKTAYLYEDDIPAQMKIQVGERVTFVNEMILYGQLKACTNQYYGGTGTSLATVNGRISVGMIRKIVKNLQANHARSVTRMLSASAKFGTSAVEEGYMVIVHTDLEPDIRDLPGFTPVSEYGSGKSLHNEIGKCERFRFIGHADLPSHQDAGAAVAGTELQSTSGTLADVYRFIVLGENAFSQIAVRGLSAMKPVFLPVGKSSPTDPFGQRGYAGACWWKAVLIENNGWMAVGNVAVKTLS